MRARGIRALATAGAMLLLGCSATTRYHVLSFLFDGVPPPTSEGGGPAAGGPPGSTTGPRRSVAAWTHGPYAAKSCDACHARATTNGLVAPRSQLCAQCHDVRPRGAVVHGPFASGDCLECHEPHASPYRYMLVTEVGALCQKCHEPDSLRANPAHEPFDEQCTACHDPHSSNQAHLLR
jgi:predicted CXXCH cytochrome family protein